MLININQNKQVFYIETIEAISIVFFNLREEKMQEIYIPKIIINKRKSLKQKKEKLKELQKEVNNIEEDLKQLEAQEIQKMVGTMNMTFDEFVNFLNKKNKEEQLEDRYNEN